MAGRTLRHLILLGMMLAGLVRNGQAAVPAGFSDTLVANVGTPTAFAFTPDGRMLITQKSGSLRIWNGTLLGTAALTIPASSICDASEQGLLGIAVDPDFAANRRIYLFYTFEKPAGGCVNRVSRFTFFAAAGQQNQVDPASELVLVDNMPSPAGNHNAGDVHFGKDGYLYIS
ncbi:MAG TPA: PQQ-dependent sugar dehydrogenase, partial [Thermoanaerobaculia bacterium]|nr:PQQ-dependent sugar dehydrogenase [Thermoanaerobaculia bacterium]